MSSIIKSVSGVLSGAGRAAKAYPAAVGCAVAFALIYILQIQFDLSDYRFIINCMLWALALGAIAGMAAVAAAQTYTKAKNASLAANLIALAIALATFALLYLSGNADRELTERVVMRVAAAIFVSLVAFVVIAGKPSDETDFPRAMFMTHKSYFIALLYGLVALGGASGVAAAVEGLIYPDMSDKVYAYISTLSFLLAFLLFVGYFPPLRAGADPERRKRAQYEPRFIEVLFCYILIPIMLALTVVLLIWAVLNVFGVTKSNFEQLAATSAMYTIGGLWLHAMTSQSENGATQIYRAVYPVTALVILAFEAWAVIMRLTVTGLKDTEYIFILIWILAAVGSILLLTMRGERRSAAHRRLAVVACALAVFAVLPGVGFYDLPVRAQTMRLESLLVREGMLVDGKLIPATVVPDEKTRAAITDAVDFLVYSDGDIPGWLDVSYSQGEVFREKFGFDKLWIYDDGTTSESDKSRSVYLYAEPGAVSIGGYEWAVMLNARQTATPFTTQRGEYTVEWITTNGDSIPMLKVSLNNTPIIEMKLDSFVGYLIEKYPPGTENEVVKQSELSVPVEGGGISALLTFSEVSITELNSGERSVWMTPSQLFARET